MSVEEISGIERTEDWFNAINKKENSITELNGRKREMTIFHQDVTPASLLYQRMVHRHYLHNQFVSEKPFQAIHLNPMGAGGTVKTKIEIEWGGDEGVTWRGVISGEAHDKHGNYVEGNIQTDQTGKSRIELESGIKKDGEIGK